MSGRGSLTLFANVFNEEVPSEVLSKPRKGRSSELHSQRNDCLIDRYYFYGKYTEKRYLAILEDLSHEFFISTVTIPELITENYELLLALKEKKPSKQYFLKKWPHLVWQATKD
jgi:hypothetical protein